ncbi:TonB-dependent receptor plug domain-containing protein [Chromobacterium sphagni]|uniref:TonB-dependent receptor plug domain-containing protein n=1 Tax=Chromobacterium sphagni TaxID=1903179 RepID=UPI0009F3BCE5|nr:TonB-dependent receptor [Chromobacterium sphagni]
MKIHKQFNSYIIYALLSGAAWPALADTASSDNSTALERVTVTGSRISRSEQKGPTSVTVITGTDIEKQGYTNVYDALNSLPQNTGFTQGADFGNTFTPAANAISLRGLGPNHTLTLINGRRVADYPTAYDGSVNFVNLANIPAAMIDRIEILNGGASAIYGSDAIAGVVNVILKKKTDGVDVNVKVGASEHHGAENGRLQISGGHSWDQLSLIYGLELSQRNAIWSNQRGFMADNSSDGSAPTTIWSRQVKQGPNKGQYIGAGNCGVFASLFNNSVRPYAIHTKTGNGVVCASGQANPDYWTIQTANQSQNGYLSANYQLNDHAELFSDALLGFNHTENNTRGPAWTSLGGSNQYFLNQNTGQYEQWTRRLAPEEIGGATTYNRKWDDLSANLTFGIRGDLPGTSWNYEAAYNASIYTSQQTAPRLLANVDSLFLGPQLGTDSNGIGIYAPNAANFATPITTAQFNSVLGRSVEQDKSWLQALSLSGSGDLFKLPAGAVKLAGALEWGSQGFSNDPDTQLGQGVFYRTSPGSHAGGTRARQAAGAELLIPLHPRLNVTLSGRYDRLAISDSSVGKFTYGSGLEFRPLDTLLLRGNYATSFRAPDMNYLFLTQSRGYYPGVTDYWRCLQAGQPNATCDYKDLAANFVKSGNPNLKPENGKSYGFGFVWSPSTDADLSLDYWNITINDLVTDLDQDKILHDEADCRSGKLDIDSSLCQDALRRVQRNPANAVLDPGAINQILTNPINAANERTSGIDLNGKLRWKTARWGRFQLQASYSQVLTFTYQQFAGDPTQDRLQDLSNHDWRNKLSASLGWNIGNWSSTLQLTRYGKVPNNAENGYLTPTILANLSVGYQLSKQTSLSLIVNNLQDFIKKDYSEGSPFYPVGTYPPYGRQVWLELNHHF